MPWLSRTLAAVLAASLNAGVHGLGSCLSAICVAGEQYLRMDSCSLTDADFADLTTCFDTVGRVGVKYLFLDNNVFTTIPSDLFDGMSFVEYMSLVNNELQSLDAATFQPMASNLASLSLATNQLTTLPSGLFAGMTTTSILILINNQLATLPGDIFEDLANIRSMYLGDNQLIALDVDIFNSLQKADFVDIRNNTLTTLPAGVFENLGSGTSLRFLLLSGNSDLQCIPANYATERRTSSSYSSSNTFSDEVVTAGLCECTDLSICDGDLTCLAGAEGYTCEGDTVDTVCADDTDCDTGAGEECCLTKLICEVPDAADPGACGDPHMTGFRGQKFDFTGEDGGWYAVVSDLPYMHLNMRVTSPVPSLPEITYITGISISTIDTDGLDHTIVISVRDPHSMESVCPAGVSLCLAEGALHVVIDGEEVMLAPEEVTVAPGVTIAAVNLPGECRSFGFENYWEQKRLEMVQQGRRLGTTNRMQDMSDWVLGDPTLTNMIECQAYVTRATAVGDTDLFEHQSEHASFQIMTPTATIRLIHGRLHQLAVRDPTDQYDLPDHLAWQINMAIDHSEMSIDATGILGETLVPTVDKTGAPIMQGMDAIRGDQEDYRVRGPLELFFTQDQLDE